MRLFKYGLIAVLAAVTPALCMASNPWTSGPGRYRVSNLAADSTVIRKETTDKVRPDIDCQDPVAKPWEDKSKKKSTVALRIHDSETGKTRIYHCR